MGEGYHGEPPSAQQPALHAQLKREHAMMELSDTASELTEPWGDAPISRQTTRSPISCSPQDVHPHYTQCGCSSSNGVGAGAYSSGACGGGSGGGMTSGGSNWDDVPRPNAYDQGVISQGVPQGIICQGVISQGVVE